MKRNKYSSLCGWMWLLAAVFMTLSYFSKVDYIKLFVIFIDLTLAEIWLQPIKKILVKSTSLFSSPKRTAGVEKDITILENKLRPGVSLISRRRLRKL